MALTLPTNIVATNTGHITHTNQLHTLANGLIYDTTNYWTVATSNSDSTAGRLMRASARAAVSGVASLDGSGNLPASQLSVVAIRNDQQNVVPLLNGLKLGTFSSVLPAPVLNLQAARGTSASPTAVQSGDYIGAYAATGQYDTTIGDYGGGAVIRFKATETFAGSAGTATNAGTQIEFVVNANATGTTALLALTLGQDASATFAGTLAVTGASVFTGNVTAPNVMQTDGTVNAVTGASGLISNTNASGILFNGIRNTGALTTSGSTLLTLRGQGATDGAGTIATGGAIVFKADAAFAAGSSPGRIEFQTTATGGVTLATRGAFTQAGIFFIGTSVLAAVWAVDQSGNTTWGEASNLVFGTTTGTKIGTATTQKIGFWNATPVVVVTGWAAATNTKLRTTFDTTTVTLPNLAARVGALIDDLLSYGLIHT